jgi:hypothetical protein
MRRILYTVQSASITALPALFFASFCTFARGDIVELILGLGSRIGDDLITLVLLIPLLLGRRLRKKPPPRLASRCQNEVARLRMTFEECENRPIELGEGPISTSSTPDRGGARERARSWRVGESEWRSMAAAG